MRFGARIIAQEAKFVAILRKQKELCDAVGLGH
jgi:hypothetical protein